jgi:hypothetical protein
MQNDDESKTEYRKNLSAGLGVGLAIGILLSSALDGLLPFPFDIFVGIIIGLLIGYLIGTRSPMLSDGIQMRYPTYISRRLLVTGALFILGMFGYVSLLNLNLPAAQKVWASLLAIIPSVLFVLVVASAVAHLDEMQRRIQVEGIAIAFAGTVIVASIFTFLGMAGIPSPNWSVLIMVMVIMWVVGKLWTMWRYE